MYRKILVPVDGSDASNRGLHEAIKLAESCGATLKLLHVTDELLLNAGYLPSTYAEPAIAAIRETGRKVLAESEAIVRQHDVVVTSELVETVGGGVADLIVKHAKEWPADLIAMGTHGRRGLRRLAMGSDAEMVLRSSPLPVLLVRAAV